ncbi:Basic secretory protein [Quillaja saponaria]|uniref:Basic secretory protein n=1 Tax=Quillaja saponaria TaxID=32244 RepID=A0AAD7KUM3_QUISA|nr:Basic secretory protein [Quillaja saponaria]
MAHYTVFICLVLSLAAVNGIHALEFVISNRAASTPGGVRFNNELGAEYAGQTMIEATRFIWNTFQQNTDADKKNVQRVTLFVDDMDGIAYAINNEIHVGANYIEKISIDIKTDFNGVLYHEMTHIWQWNGNGQQGIGGLIEGIADFVRLKAGYAPSHWVQPGGGDKWDQGYDVTARFLDYCNDLRNGFVAELNKKMRDSYSDNYFVELLGKSVDQLWTEYKARYGN